MHDGASDLGFVGNSTESLVGVKAGDSLLSQGNRLLRTVGPILNSMGACSAICSPSGGTSATWPVREVTAQQRQRRPPLHRVAEEGLVF